MSAKMMRYRTNNKCHLNDALETTKNQPEGHHKAKYYSVFYCVYLSLMSDSFD